MILAIPFSHSDIGAASRLLRWIWWLSAQNGLSMKREKLLLVPSRHASQRRLHREMCRIATKIFGEARSFTPATEHEVGWPGACNFMLKETLEHVEKHFHDDVFILEPDAIPLEPLWWDLINSDWNCVDQEYKQFYGAHCPLDIEHMSGIGVYGKNWRSVAPKLAEVQGIRGWDTYAADQMVPHTHFTKKIQHFQWISNPAVSYPRDLTLDFPHPEAVIFHQDKQGKLIRLIDQRDFEGKADQVVGYSREQQEERVSMNYFFNHNYNRKITFGELELNFNYHDQLAGTSRGILATDNEAEVIALASMAADPATGIIELSAEDYAEMTKKKVRRWENSKELIVPSPQGKEQVAQIIQSPAVLVAEPANKVEDVMSGQVVDDIEKIIKFAKIKMPEHVAKRKPERRKAA